MIFFDNVVDFDENLRLVGTAHVSSKSVETVKAQILEYARRRARAIAEQLRFNDASAVAMLVPPPRGSANEWHGAVAMAGAYQTRALTPEWKNPLATI